MLSIPSAYIQVSPSFACDSTPFCTPSADTASAVFAFDQRRFANPSAVGLLCVAGTATA